MAIKKRCLRCLKQMRNDGTIENPKYVCNNPSCVRYVPPKKDENTNKNEHIN